MSFIKRIRDDEGENRARSRDSSVELKEAGAPPAWWAILPDEALLREVLPGHRPEYC